MRARWMGMAVACVLGGVLSGCIGRTYGAPTGPVLGKPQLIEVASIPGQQLTGVAVTQDARVFVCFPRWSENVPVSVAEIVNGQLKPYPNEEWNRWTPAADPKTHLVCVQSVFVDREDFLWILDPASPNMAGVVSGGPKLLKVDTRSGNVVQTIFFDETVAPPKSYLNDVRVDASGQTAYISESGLGAIIVTNLKSGKSRRLLGDHPSTKSENIPVTVKGVALRLPDGSLPQVHCDGIALDPKSDYVYYHALTARTLYRVRTRALLDEALAPADLAAHVEKLEATGAVDGMAMSLGGFLYMTSLETGAITFRSPTGELGAHIIDPRLAWPDSLSILFGRERFLYVSDSQIQAMPRFNGGKDVPVGPYKVYKVQIRE